MRDRRFIYFILLMLACSLLVYGCDSGGGGGGGGGGDSSGVKVIDFSGGNGIANSAGSGGNMSVGSYSDIEIKSSGSADASFSLPASTNLPSYIACTNEFKPGSSVTLNAFSNTDTLGTPGGYYLMYGDTDLRYDNDMDGIANITDITVDCVSIPNGVTVTLGLNYDGNNLDTDANHSTGADYAYILLTGDLRVAGTLKAALLNSPAGPDVANGFDSGALQLYANDIFVTASGTVSAAGLDNPTGLGGHGAWIDIEAFQGNGGTLVAEGTLDCSGGNGDAASDGGIGCAIINSSGVSPNTLTTWADQYNINKGNIYTYGGSGGANGGDAGSVLLEADSHVYHTGTINAAGGNGSSTAAGAVGGNGTTIGIYSYYASVNISGSIDGSGGPGADGGGKGADLEISSGYSGSDSTGFAAPTNISGPVTVKGGDALRNGDGGDGGYILIYNYGGTIKVSGNLSGQGGNGAGPDSGGGSGTFIELGLEYYSEPWGNALPAGGIVVSGNLNVSGGDGDYGADSGYIDVYHDYNVGNPGYVLPEAYPIQFLGYSKIDGHGGSTTSGGANGGSAGEIYMETFNPITASGPLLCGHIENQVNIDLSGGDGDPTSGSGGTGGQGGAIGMYANREKVLFDAENKINYVLNTGDLDLSAGKGDVGGFASTSFIQIYGYNEVKNTGIINLNAGNGTSNGGECNSWITLYSSQNVINSGKITAMGGNGTDGDGGFATSYLGLFAGDQTRNSGALSARGGNGNMTTGTGGDGGKIELWSQMKATSNTASLSVAGGSANINGANGIIWMDGGDITPADGTL